jgi:hypothetical protein
MPVASDGTTAATGTPAGIAARSVPRRRSFSALRASQSRKR